MKVIYVTDNYRYIQPQIVHHLIDNGIDASMYKYDFRITGIHRDYPSFVISYTCPTHLRGPLFYITRLRIIAENLAKKANIADCDVLHGNMVFSDGTVCRYLNKKYGVPYILSVRDTDINMAWLWKIPWIRKNGIKNLLSAKAIVFLSHPYVEKLVSRLPGNIQEEVRSKSLVIPNGIDEFFLNNIWHPRGRPNDQLKVAFVGTLNKRKNIELVIHAVELLRLEGYDITLEVMGEIEDARYLNLLKNYSFLNYHGKGNKEDVVSFLRSCDVFVLPSHTETFGLVYAEAITQGMPVIYTRGQGFDGQFDNGFVGYATSDTDVTELVTNIKLTWGHYEALSKNCIASCAKFDWNTIINEIIASYIKAIKQW